MCKLEFKKETKSYAYYCPTCRKKKNVEKVMKSRKKRIPETQIGVGSGGNQAGSNNPSWKGGYSIYKKTCKDKEECQLCGSKRFLIVHHKDGNRKNGKKGNLIRVCRKCHAKLHKLHLNFKVAE
jgi:hypothetical protein